MPFQAAILYDELAKLRELVVEQEAQVQGIGRAQCEAQPELVQRHMAPLLEAFQRVTDACPAMAPSDPA